MYTSSLDGGGDTRLGCTVLPSSLDGGGDTRLESTVLSTFAQGVCLTSPFLSSSCKIK